MKFETLPPDLIYMICETLCQHCTPPALDWTSHYPWVNQPQAKPNRQTLLKLSLLCKSWGYVAQKILHHHFGILETTLIAEVLFCRTVSQNPDLAKMVQSIRLRNIDTTDNASPIEDWITEPLNKFSELLNFPGTTFDSEVSNWESFIAPLILLQVPNLKYLHVGHKGDCLLFDKFDKPAVVRQQALPLYINSLMVGYDLELDGTLSTFPGPLDISEDGLGGIFPALKRLGYLDICSPNIDTVRHPLQLQNIKRLYCRRFALRKKQLRSLVSSIAALEVFDYYGSGNPWQYYATGQDICEVLAPHKDTLRFMTLVGYYRQGSFMPLRQLRNLAALKFTAEAFWDPDHEPILDEQALIAGLPPSLQCIAYEIDEKTWEGTIDSIIAYLLSAGKQHTLRCFQILLSGGKYAVVWDETATLRFRDSIRAIVQRVEEMSEQIIDRQRTGTVSVKSHVDTPFPFFVKFPF